VAERVCGAGHRLDPTRVPRSCDRDERGGAAPHTSGLRRVLHGFTNPSGARQGHAVLASGHTAVSRSHRCHSGRRRSASPFRPHRRVAVVQRRSQRQPTVPPVRSTRLRCSELLPMSVILRALVGCRRGLTPALEASKWSVLSSFRLFGRHTRTPMLNAMWMSTRLRTASSLATVPQDCSSSRATERTSTSRTDVRNPPIPIRST
jgi:hypothetical protein